MSKIKVSAFLICILMVAICLGACSKEDTSKITDAEGKILNIMMNCPNEKFYSSSLISVIGEGTENKELIEDEKIRKEEIFQNWENEVGQYFDENGLQRFLSEGPATWYFVEAELNKVNISIKEMQTLESSELTKNVKVVLQKGKVEQEVVVIFCYNSEGLITEVIIGN